MRKKSILNKRKKKLKRRLAWILKVAQSHPKGQSRRGQEGNLGDSEVTAELLEGPHIKNAGA